MYQILYLILGVFRDGMGWDTYGALVGGVLFLITGLLGYGGYLESTLASTYLQGKKVKSRYGKKYNHGI